MHLAGYCSLFIKFRNPKILLGISVEGNVGRKWFSGYCTSPLKVAETQSINQHTAYSDRPKKPEALGTAKLRLSAGMTVRCGYEKQAEAKCSHFSFLSYRTLHQCFSNFVRPRPGKFFFHKTRARSQQIYSSAPFQFFFRFVH